MNLCFMYLVVWQNRLVWCLWQQWNILEMWKYSMRVAAFNWECNIIMWNLQYSSYIQQRMLMHYRRHRCERYFTVMFDILPHLYTDTLQSRIFADVSLPTQRIQASCILFCGLSIWVGRSFFFLLLSSSPSTHTTRYYVCFPVCWFTFHPCCNWALFS